MDTKANGKALAVPRWDRSGDMVMDFAGGDSGDSLEVRYRIAKAIATSGMTQHKKPEAVLAIMLTCYEMGLPVMQGLRGMYLVSGKIGLEGHLMDALAIERCGVSKTVKEQSLERCRLVLHRPQWDDLEVEYTMADAIRANLVSKVDGDKVVSSKQPWRQNPKEMLYWRALSKGLKQIAPDYFGGVYHTDELEEEVRVQQKADTVSTNEELDALEALEVEVNEEIEGRDTTPTESEPEPDPTPDGQLPLGDEPTPAPSAVSEGQ